MSFEEKLGSKSVHGKRAFWLRLLLIAGVLALVLTATLWLSLRPGENTLEIVCKTEIISAVLTPNVEGAWYFEDVLVTSGLSRDSERFTGAATFRGPLSLELQRIADGPVLLRIEPLESGSFSLSRAEGGAAVAPAGATIIRVDNLRERIEAGQSLVLYFRGDVRLGSLQTFTAHQFTPLLRGCSVQVIGIALGTGRKFVGAEFEVAPGEELVVGPEPADARTIVSVSEESAMQAAVRVLGKSVDIDRLGAAGYRLEMTSLDRWAKDPVLSTIWRMAALFAAWFVTILSLRS